MMAKNDFSFEENYQEKKKLTELVFEKAKKESREVAKTALAHYIDENSSLRFKTSTRMYDRYILGDNKISIPTTYTLNSASEFMGYNSFADFCLQNFSEQKTEGNEKENLEQEDEIKKFDFSRNSSKNKTYLKGGIAGLGIAAVIGLSSYLGMNEKQNKCMFWDKNSYEKINCDEKINPLLAIIPYDEQVHKYFYKIEPTDTTTFFRAGKPAIWYSKKDGKIEFFSAPGNHPENGKQLKPITKYIIKKYVTQN